MRDGSKKPLAPSCLPLGYLPPLGMARNTTSMTAARANASRRASPVTSASPLTVTTPRRPPGSRVSAGGANLPHVARQQGRPATDRHDAEVPHVERRDRGRPQALGDADHHAVDESETQAAMARAQLVGSRQVRFVAPLDGVGA